MERVFLCSPYNSTFFTGCCGTAICDDQPCCPSCGKEVYPGKDVTKDERQQRRWAMAYSAPGGAM